ncbi:MAG: signal peptidase I [Oscillospiraceae bacterium]|jgi:signal peptidase I
MNDNKGNLQPEKVTVGSELYDWAQALVTAIVFIVLLFTFVGRIIGVDGTSMLPTLQDGDRVVLQGILYEPKAGDIVVLTKKSFDEDPIVKRVIATEGQTVDIDFQTGALSIDGVVQDEPYIADLTHNRGDMTFPAVVPKDCIFVMGDNRNGSTDSRFSVIGMVDKRYVLGRVFMRVYPFNKIGSIS